MTGLFLDLRIAVRNLLQHGRRTVFLGVAIGTVTALLVLLQGLATGIRETMINTATTLTTGHVNVGGFFKLTAGQSAPVVIEYEKVLQVVKATVPEMAYSVQRGRGWAKIVSDTGSMQAGIGGIDVLEEPGFKKALSIVEGRLEDLAQPNTILLFEDQARRLGRRLSPAQREAVLAKAAEARGRPLSEAEKAKTVDEAEREGRIRPGDAITISAQTTRGVANTIDCRVVAIAKDVGLLSRWNVYIPSQSLRALYQLRPDATGAIHIHLREEAVPRLGAVAERLRKALADDPGLKTSIAGVMDADPRAFWMKFETVNREGWTGQKLDVTTWEDELSFMMWSLQLLGGLTLVLMIILVGIVVTGIMNTLWIAIRERTREIGTLRAIGMQRRGVLRLFLLETLLLGVGATVVGALLGAAVAAGINGLRIEVPLSVQLFLMSDHLQLSVPPALIISAVVLISLVTTLASIAPAVRAARLRPVSAMSHFG